MFHFCSSFHPIPGKTDRWKEVSLSEVRTLNLVLEELSPGHNTCSGLFGLNLRGGKLKVGPLQECLTQTPTLDPSLTYLPWPSTPPGPDLSPQLLQCVKGEFSPSFSG